MSDNTFQWWFLSLQQHCDWKVLTAFDHSVLMSWCVISHKKWLWKQKQHQQNYIFCQHQAAAAAADTTTAAVSTAVIESFADLSLSTNQKTVKKVLVVHVSEKSENSAFVFMIITFTISAATNVILHSLFCASVACQHFCYLLQIKAITVVSRKMTFLKNRITVILFLHSEENDWNFNFITNIITSVIINNDVHFSKSAQLSFHNLATQQFWINWNSFCFYNITSFFFLFVSLSLQMFFTKCWLFFIFKSFEYEFEWRLFSSQPHTILTVTFFSFIEWSQRI